MFNDFNSLRRRNSITREIPPIRVEYRITKNGLNLLVELYPLLDWIKHKN